MYKVLWFLARKQGISHEQFRAHYENSHAPLAMKHFGHLFREYRRNYRTATFGGSALADGGAGFGPRPWRYDVVAEWVLDDETAFDAIMAGLAEPELARLFYEDEEHFLDRDSIFLVKCEVHETAI